MAIIKRDKFIITKKCDICGNNFTVEPIDEFFRNANGLDEERWSIRFLL